MDFYLNNELIDNVTNGVVINETLDDTLPTANVILALNDVKEPIKPYTPFKIVDSGEELYFVVQSDNVELESKRPLIFKHTLNLIEETEVLRTQQIRNTICQQPSRKKKTKVLTQLDDVTKASEKIEIKSYEHIKKIRLEVYPYLIAEDDRAGTLIYMSAQRYSINALVQVKANGTTIFSQEKERNSDGEIIELPVEKYNNLQIEITRRKTEINREGAKIYSACAKLFVETYYYSMLDVISLIRTRSNNAFTISRNLSELSKVVAPNFAFTENNVYEALSEVFSFIDGRPILKNGEVDIKYYNEHNEREVLNEDLTGYKSTLTSEKYANGLMSKFQNGGLETPLIYPSEKDFAYSKPTDVGVPTESGWAFVVDKKIRYLEKLAIKGEYVFPLTDGTFDYNINMKTILLDVTDYTFEDTNYLQLPKIANVDFNELSTKDLQNNSIHYKSGSNEINYFNISKTIIGTSVYGLGFTLLRAFFGEICRSEGFTLKKYSWDGITIQDKDLAFQVTYYPIADGKLIIEQSKNKHNGLLRLSQSNGATSINRMGQNLYGQLLRMGNEERVATPKVCAFRERYKVGDSFESEWIVNKATTTIFKSFAFQTLQLTKNYNKMSQFVRLNQVKRFNEIDSSVVGKSEEIVREYLYFSLNSLTSSRASSLDFDYLQNGIMATLNGSNEFVDKVSMSAFTNGEIDYYVRIPMLKYGSGNALCFEFSFESPISAGTQLVKDEAFYGEKYFSKYCLYADENGRFNDFEIDCGYWYNKLINEDTFAENHLKALPYINTTIDYSDSLLGEAMGWKSLLKIKGEFDKQANEIFALNYEIICLSLDKNLFIGNTFITQNKLVDNTERGGTYLWFSNEKYSVMDTFAKGTKGGRVNATINGNVITLGTSQKCNAWAIANEQGELLLSCNEPKENGDIIMFYLSASKNRL